MYPFQPRIILLRRQGRGGSGPKIILPPPTVIPGNRAWLSGTYAGRAGLAEDRGRPQRPPMGVRSTRPGDVQVQRMASAGGQPTSLGMRSAAITNSRTV